MNLLPLLPQIEASFEYRFLIEAELPTDPIIDELGIKYLHHHPKKRLAKFSRIADAEISLPPILSKQHFELVHYLFHGDAVRKTPCPYIVSVYDTIQSTKSNLYSAWHRLKHRCIDILHRKLVQGAGAIITISQHSKEDIVKHYAVDSSHVFVTFPAVDARYKKLHSPEQLASVRAALKLPEDFLLYVGGIDPRKNIPTLLRALSALYAQEADAPPLVFAGHIHNQREYPALMMLIDELQLRNRIIFLDYVDERYMPELFAMARIFLFPSLYEGFGLPLLQALASGTPTITSRYSSLPEVAGEAAQYIDPTDPASITQGIITLLDDSSICDALKNDGRMQAARFSWERCAEETVAVYRHVLEQR